MQKQEAIQLHTLLKEVVNNLANEREDVTLGQDDLTRYNQHNIFPQAIHKKVSDHEDAVLDLAKDLADTLLDEGVVEKEAELVEA